jgi:SAM-dependent methyltransferase
VADGAREPWSRSAAKRLLPARAQAWLRARRSRVSPPVGRVRLGGLRRLKPISDRFGFDRGQPVDRYYIEQFLARHGGPSGDIKGRVLEFGDDSYTRTFGASPGGGAAGVSQVDILDIDSRNPRATIVADLASGEGIPSDAFDCVICTQTLFYIFDLQAAVATLARILKPGGVVLATLPGISKIAPPAERDYWRFTSSSARRLFEGSFPASNLSVEAHGNVLSAISFLDGLASGELKPSELEFRDPAFEVIVAVRAIK